MVVFRYLKRNLEDGRIERRSVGRNHEDVISAQNKEDCSSSPRNTKTDWLAQGGRRPVECWSGRNIVQGSQTSDVGLD